VQCSSCMCECVGCVLTLLCAYGTTSASADPVALPRRARLSAQRDQKRRRACPLPCARLRASDHTTHTHTHAQVRSLYRGMGSPLVSLTILNMLYSTSTLSLSPCSSSLSNRSLHAHTQFVLSLRPAQAQAAGVEPGLCPPGPRGPTPHLHLHHQPRLLLWYVRHSSSRLSQNNKLERE
jgi:hypothetical protein